MFEDDLLDYLESYRAKSGLSIKQLRDYDFSTAKAILIPSVPGTHTGAAIHKYGHMKIRQVLSREPIPSKFAQAPIVAQFSSMGSTTKKWLDELRMSMSKRATPPGANATSSVMAAAELPPLRAIWPTFEQVRNSLEGWSAGGSLCCDSKNMEKFPHELLYLWDGQGQRRHLAMPHIKSYVRATEDGECAWVSALECAQHRSLECGLRLIYYYVCMAIFRFSRLPPTAARLPGESSRRAAHS
jgi:tyrosyl-DNA phosphodiesterase-1